MLQLVELMTSLNEFLELGLDAVRGLLRTPRCDLADVLALFLHAPISVGEQRLDAAVELGSERLSQIIQHFLAHPATCEGVLGDMCLPGARFINLLVEVFTQRGRLLVEVLLELADLFVELIRQLVLG